MASRPWVLCWSNGVDAPTLDPETIEQAHTEALAWAEAATGNVALVRLDYSNNDTLYVIPAVGQKVAINVGSDRYQYEVSEVRPNGKTIFIRRGDKVLQARKQADGDFKLWGARHKGFVNFIHTETSLDPSF